MNITITFGQSRSPNYKNALSYAAKFSNFVPASDDNPFNTVSIDIKEAYINRGILDSFWTLIKGWTSASLYMDGIRVDFDTLRGFMRDIYSCYLNFPGDQTPEEYCKFYGRLGWGCKHLNDVRRSMTSMALMSETFQHHYAPYVFDFGEFISPYIWKIDKDRVRSMLKIEAERDRLDVCKHFSFDKVENELKKIPDTINTLKSTQWRVIKDRFEINGEIFEQPIGIWPTSPLVTYEDLSGAIDYALTEVYGQKKWKMLFGKKRSLKIVK